MANIKLTELSELVAANNQNTIFYVADLSVSPNVSHYIRLGAFASDNAIAYLAFERANTALSVGWNANIAFNRANSAYNHANTGYTQANSAASFANGAFTRANSEPIGTSAASFANGAFTRANSAASFANGAFVHANAAYDYANTISTGFAFDRANAAYNHANSAYDFANTISGSGAFDRANAAFAQANNAFNVANVVFTRANSAASFANGAFTRANNSVLKAGDSITGIVTAPTAAPGTSNTMIATTKFVSDSVNTGLGIGQTWTDVANLRANNATYTNSTNKPIAVYVRVEPTFNLIGSGNYFIAGYVGSAEVSYDKPDASILNQAIVQMKVSFIVPPGQSYKVVFGSLSGAASITIRVWNELR